MTEKKPYSIGDTVHFDITVLPNGGKHKVTGLVTAKLSEWYYVIDYSYPQTGKLSTKRLIHSYLY